MQVLSTDKLIEYFDYITDIVATIKDSNKKKNILTMLDDLAERLISAPASTHKKFHGAFKGGLLYHLLKTYLVAQELQDMYKKLGYSIDWTEDELKVACLLHDIGKLGEIDLGGNQDLYLPVNSQWHEKNGITYEKNKHLRAMEHPAQSLYIIQHYGIKLTFNEYYSILLHHGAYDEANKPYFSNFNNIPDHNLPLLVHQADVIASKIEKQEYSS